MCKCQCPEEITGPLCEDVISDQRNEINSSSNFNLNCDFEDGFCDWIQSETRDTSNWVRENSPKYTKDRSIYVYMSNDDSSETFKNAILISPELNLTKSEGLCLKFDFYFDAKEGHKNIFNGGKIMVKKRVNIYFFKFLAIKKNIYSIILLRT